MSKADYYNGLNSHFKRESEVDAKIVKRNLQAQRTVNKTIKKEQEIEANYHMDCLNPINRYKHTHRSSEKRPEKVKLKNCEVVKTEVKNGKRIIKLMPKNKG